MITEKQHLEICQKIADLRALGVPVYTYTGEKVIQVVLKEGYILLDNNTRLSQVSYKPNTRVKDAWKKFHVREITLHDIRKNRKVLGSVKKRYVNRTEMRFEAAEAAK